MMLNALFAVGLLLSTASQVRASGFLIGPGELCLLIWLGATTCQQVVHLGPPLTPALSRLLIFWALFAVAESLGVFAAAVIGDEHDPQWFLHDVMAYPLIAAVSCLSVVEPNAGPRLRRFAWHFAALGSAALALLLAQGYGLIELPLIDPWYWDRFRGWSAIPNQLAVLCVALGFVSLHLAETATRLSERIAALGCAILPIYVGRLTKSDAFNLVLLVVGPLLGALTFRSWLLSADRSLTFRSALAGMVALALPLIVASLAPLGSFFAVASEISRESAQATEEEAGQRLELWTQALGRGVESGMLGLGPGPHLQIPTAILAGRESTGHPKNIEHPEPSYLPNFEAHNTVLDLFTQGGLVAALCFIWISGTAIFVAYKARLAGLVAAVCGLNLFGMFHLIVRHPIFWFAIGLCLVAGTQAAGPAPARTKDC
jgi:O-Antigen ligase